MRDGFFKAAELQTVRKPVARVAACGKCGLYRGCHSPKMPVAGKGRRKILIVGEAPGENEDRRGLPFVGDAGDRLRRPLNRAGIDLFGDCWVTNAARCFVGGTRIESPSGTKRIYRRAYMGTLVSVNTLSGRVLTGTPNHPILTPSGWVALGLLKKGDDLVCCSLGKGPDSGRPDIDDPPATFKEAFDSLSQLGDVHRMVGRGVDFHGDGEDRQVDVVTTDGFLGDRVQSSGDKEGSKAILVASDETVRGFALPRRVVQSLSGARFTGNSPGGFVGGGSKGKTAFASEFTKANFHAFAPSSKDDSRSTEDEAKSILADAEGVRQRLQALPATVTTDRVVKIERKVCNQLLDGDDGADGSCHVYNLESGHGYYTANGIVVSNCRPPLNKLPDKAVEHCRPFALRAIEELKPRLILLLGNAALKSVVGYLWNDDLKGVERWAGWKIPNRRWNCWVLPTWHPSHILRCDGKEPVKEMLFDAHVEAVADFRKRPYPDGVPELDQDVRVVTDVGEAAREIGALAAGGCIAFDLETTTLKPHGPDAQIVCCSMSDGKTSIAYPWHGKAVKMTLAVMKDKTVRKRGWNARFEHEWLLFHHGVEVCGWEWDGMTTSHSLDARPGVTGLEFQEFVRLGVEDHKGPIKKYMKAKGGGNAPNRIKELSVTQLLRYCGMDSLVEYRIDELQMKEFNRG